MTRMAIVVLLLSLAGVAVGEEPPAGVAGEVWMADVGFDRASAEGDLEAFAALLADAPVFLGSGLLEGREAVLAAWAPLFASGWPVRGIRLGESRPRSGTATRVV